MNKQQPVLVPWTCKKCGGSTMIIVEIADEIKVFCANKECIEPFPQLQVSVIPANGKEDPKVEGPEVPTNITPANPAKK